jgi:hypothetical protein
MINLVRKIRVTREKTEALSTQRLARFSALAASMLIIFLSENDQKAVGSNEPRIAKLLSVLSASAFSA